MHLEWLTNVPTEGVSCSAITERKKTKYSGKLKNVMATLFDEKWMDNSTMLGLLMN
jgi:hypothetical protein